MAITMRQPKLQLPKACLNVCLVLVYGLPMISAWATMRTLLINRSKICADKVNYTITKDIVYQVKEDENPESPKNPFMTCELTFNAKDKNGHLCLVQDYPTIQIADPLAKLEAFDGLNGTQIFSVASSEHWDATEVCTQSKYVKLFLYNGNFGLPVDMSDITINLRVMHISGDFRRIDMAYDACEKTFVLDHSQINVYNRQMPQDIKGRKPFRLKSVCQVHIKRLSSLNRNICIKYVPEGEPDCGSQWNFFILKERNILAASNILYKMDCNNLKARDIHAWCAPNTIDQVSLFYARANQIPVWSNNSIPERPEQYRILVTDFEGGNVRKLLGQLVPKKTVDQIMYPAMEFPRHTTTVPQPPRSNAVSNCFDMALWILLSVGVGLLSGCTHLRLL